MASPLDPGSPPRRIDSGIGKGHGTRVLGPSDSSDSGSDLIGASLDADLGEPDLDSDTDRYGTGEAAAAGGAVFVRDGADIDADHIEILPLDMTLTPRPKGARRKP